MTPTGRKHAASLQLMREAELAAVAGGKQTFPGRRHKHEDQKDSITAVDALLGESGTVLPGGVSPSGPVGSSRPTWTG